MQIYGLYLSPLVILFIVQHLIDAKSLNQRSVKENDAVEISDLYNSPLKSIDKTASYHSLSYNPSEAEEETDVQSSVASSSLKLPKINTQGTQCYDVASSKRSTEDDLKVAPHSNAHAKYKKRRSPYGIVYNQGKPIGILEPISHIYEYQDVQDQTEVDARTPVKRDTSESGEFETDNVAALAPENTRYANTLTNFKIDSRVNSKPLIEDALLTQSNERKPDKSINKRSINPSENGGKEKRDLSDKNLAQIEDNLKQIMSDLGLIKDEDKKLSKRDIKKSTSDKRDTILEDEDLESGVNKIGITKELHSSETRNKKNNYGSTLLETNMLNDNGKQVRKGVASVPNEEVNIEGESTNKKAKKSRIMDYRSEGETFIRKKRQQGKATTENNDLMKGLESSGDLTVSGNKSPLASSSTASLDSEGKQKVLKERNEKREKQIEDQEYEKRLQRNIQDKLMKIKDDVKREINTLKGQKPAESIKEIVATKPVEQKRNVEHEKKSEIKAREKRNLLDKESENIKPDQNVDGPQKNHIRKRRDLNSDAEESDMEDDDEVKDDRVTWHELEDEDKSGGDVNKRESHHNPNNYEFESRTKRKDEFKIMAEPQESKSKEDVIKQFPASSEASMNNMEKRNYKENTENGGDGSDSGFWDVQNQNVAKIVDNPVTRVVVPRESETKNALAASNSKNHNLNNPENSDNLDKLVSESTSLSQSVKNERGADQISNIEVELHTGGNEKLANAQKKREKQGGNEDKNDDNKKKRESKVAKRSPPVTPFSTQKLNDDKQSDALESQNQLVSGDTFKIFDAPMSKLVPDNIKSEAPNSKQDAKLVDKIDDMAKDDDVKVTDNHLKDKRNDNKVKKIVKRSSDQSSESKEIKSKTTKRSSNQGEKKSENKDLIKESNESTGARLSRSSNSILEENESKPDISLEDMQRLDSENNSKRKKRFIREKRDGVNDQPNSMQFRTYRGDEDEADDESDEFDDDNFDDRTANLIRKRDLANGEDTIYDEFDEDYEPVSSTNDGHKDKRNTYLHNYISNINSDIYDNPNYLYGTDNSRKKRSTFTDLVGIHSGGPMLRHLAAARERSMQPVDNARMKRLEKHKDNKANKDQGIAGLSEADFGGLPQSYEGELSRFKRVKRDGVP